MTQAISSRLIRLFNRATKYKTEEQNNTITAKRIGREALGEVVEVRENTSTEIFIGFENLNELIYCEMNLDPVVVLETIGEYIEKVSVSTSYANRSQDEWDDYYVQGCPIEEYEISEQQLMEYATIVLFESKKTS